MKKYLPPTRYAPPYSCKSIFEPIDRDTIVDAFRKQGWGLPADYADFLCEWNGCGFGGNHSLCFPTAPEGQWQHIHFEWPERESDFTFEIGHAHQSLDCLSGIGTGLREGLDLFRNQENYHFRSFVPTEFICIGAGHFDDRIALGVTGEHFGKVAYFHGAECCWPVEGDPIPSIDYLNLAALTFRDFWDSLICVPIRGTTDD